METLGNFFQANPAPNYYCKNCDYNTSRKSNYFEHVMTSKHKRNSNGNLYQPFSSKIQQPAKYSCQFCYKEYNNKSGLWKHKQKCNVSITTNEPTDKELILMLIKENSELKNMMVKVINQYGDRHSRKSLRQSHNHHLLRQSSSKWRQFHLEYQGA